MFDDPVLEHEKSILHRHASAVLLAAVCGIGLMVLLVMSGMFDPKPIGTLAETLQPGAVSGQRWLTTVPDTFAARMMIDSAEIESAILYGTPDEHIAIAIGTDGYLALWQASPAGVEYLYPWQTWVHVRSDSNEIWIDMQPEKWTIRVNREVFYEGEPLVAVSGRELGVMGDVSAEISSLQIFK